jgi:hypothetical protein
MGDSMSVKPRTRSQLASDYEDLSWRERFLDLLAVVDVLSHCVIEANFKVSDDLNKAIILTEAGRKVRDQLITKESVDAKDANLLCLLGLVHLEPLIDIMHIEIDRLVDAISAYVLSGRMKFPLVFGRSLYDAATTLIPEERSVLKHEDTIRILEGKPQGVFHTGPFLIGPFGMHRMEHNRNLAPRLAVPVQHCADLSCPTVHNVRLTTSSEATINKNRSTLYKVLDQVSKDPADWNGFVIDITEGNYNPYQIDDGSTFPFLLGDAFSDEELRRLLRHAASSTSGRLMQAAARFQLHGGLDTWLPSLDRAQLLQLLLTETDETLAGFLDDVIRDGEIEIPPGEVRRPVVNHRTRSGAWRLRPEVSRLGYRVRPNNPTTTLLRLFALVRSLFDQNSAEDMDELAWMLRNIPGQTPTERLEAFFKSHSPREIISTLVLSRRKSAERTGELLRLDTARTDDDFLDVVLWKLGFALDRRSDVRDNYWRLHEELETFATTASASAKSTEADLRAISSNYFVALERFLFDSLTFATWSLLTDHVVAQRPYEYHETPARTFTVATLNGSVSRKTGVEQNDLREEPELSGIVQGFLRLADHLAAIRDRAGDFERPVADLPRFVDQTDLQRFPFLHTLPFLDLVPASQFTLPETLKKVGKKLGESGIMTARNGLVHAKIRRTPTIVEVNDALNNARIALRLLEEIGCVRNTFETVSTEIDTWGRFTTLLRSNGAEIRFLGPSGYGMLGLPSLDRPVYLMQGAVFAEPNEMLRFKEGFDSPYADYWAGIPHRPERGSGTSPSQPDQLLDELASPAPVA